jgi:plastocyanin
MTYRRLIACAAGLAVAAGATGAAVAAGGSAPSKAVITAKVKYDVKVNRYFKSELRWDRDNYQVRSGGTIKIVNHAQDEGPHTLTVVKKKDLPKTPGQIFQCKICESLGKAHGADPESDAPPKFLFLENGVGQDTPPNYDRPGDSGFVDAKKSAFFTAKVTAKKGTSLYFVCLIHPWMQAKVTVR